MTTETERRCAWFDRLAAMSLETLRAECDRRKARAAGGYDPILPYAEWMVGYMEASGCTVAESYLALKARVGQPQS